MGELNLQQRSRLADAVTRGSDNKFYFAEPFVEQMTMADFLSKLKSGSTIRASSIPYRMSPIDDECRFDMFGNVLSAISEWKSLLYFLFQRGRSRYAFGI